MAITAKMARDNARTIAMERIAEFLEQLDEEVLVTKSNEICYPIVDELGEEQFIRITISVPTGSKGEPYDAYELAEEYSMKQAEAAEKAKAKEAAKQAKIERDKAYRAKKAAMGK